MPSNAATAEDRLARLGIHLPDAPTPFGAYVPAVQQDQVNADLLAFLRSQG